MHWKDHANKNFIPHLFKLFESHPQLRKAEAQKAGQPVSNPLPANTASVPMELDQKPPFTPISQSNGHISNSFRNREQVQQLASNLSASSLLYDYINPQVVEVRPKRVFVLVSRVFTLCNGRNFSFSSLKSQITLPGLL
mgnify:CR=1 FL=1